MRPFRHLAAPLLTMWGWGVGAALVEETAGDACD